MITINSSLKKVIVNDIISIKYCNETIIQIIVFCNDDIDVINYDVDDIIEIWFENPVDCKIMIEFRGDYISYVNYIKLDMTEYDVYISSSRAGCSYSYVDKIVII